MPYGWNRADSPQASWRIMRRPDAAAGIPTRPLTYSGSPRRSPWLSPSASGLDYSFPPGARRDEGSSPMMRRSRCRRRLATRRASSNPGQLFPKQSRFNYESDPLSRSGRHGVGSRGACLSGCSSEKFYPFPIARDESRLFDRIWPIRKRMGVISFGTDRSG